MATEVVTRRAGSGDLDALLDDVAAGFASYVEFAPAGWRPPERDAHREWEAEVLADPDTWALLALVDDAPVGHVAFMAARERADPGAHWRSRPVIPGLAHFWQLFVLPEWWGRGVAPLLHRAAVAEMRSRGYRTGRLYTPSGHVRARRFYERRGWSAISEAFNEDLRLPLTEYRLALGLGDQAPGSQPSR